MAESRLSTIALTPKALRFLDQTCLPTEETIVETADYRVLLEAIRSLRLRGAPLIGISAAYGVTLAAREAILSSSATIHETLFSVCDQFAATRPTAVNLFWALARMRSVIDATPDAQNLPAALEAEALAIHEDDAMRCSAIGRHGAEMIPSGAGVITHCNTGALATGGDGTAFSVLLAAHRAGKNIHVYADETRPLLQGARLTMWELQRAGIPSTLITDSTAAMLMRSGRVQVAITGADRIAVNGDSANKIGTYGLAVAARHHGIPFYIAAPVSTIDFAIISGRDIPIEQRAAAELTEWGGRRIAPPGVACYTPAFDVTPSDLITGIITERGICAPSEIATLSTPRS
jgi:methylthioribose-1-phosphate isomerase